MKCRGCIFFTGEHSQGHGESFGNCTLKSAYRFNNSNCQFKGHEDVIQAWTDKIRQEIKKIVEGKED